MTVRSSTARLLHATLGVALAASGLLGLTFVGAAPAAAQGHMMGGMDCGMMGGAMLLTGLLLLGLLAVGIWLIVRAATGSTSGSRTGAQSSALAILEERYARGELDDDEFHRRRRLLESPDAGRPT